MKRGEIWTLVGGKDYAGLVGRLDDEDLLRLSRALLVFLGLAGSQKRADAN